MKKSSILLSILLLSVFVSAQTGLNFESEALGSTDKAAGLWGGGIANVIANPYATGINTSAKVLQVVNNDYCSVFLKIALPMGTKTSYPYLTVRYKLCYVGPNGGTDLNYPNTDFYSVPSSAVDYAAANTSPAVMKFASSISWNGGVSWGSPTVGTWIQCSFTFSNSTLTSIPGGYLVIKIAKPKLEYLIDDVELVPSPIAGANILTVEDYETKNIDDVLATTATGLSATVKVNPSNPAQKSAFLVPSSYGSYLSLPVVLPTGKVLSDYDRLYFDIYLTGTSTKQMVVKANATTIFADDGYPAQGTAGVWQSRDYSFAGLDLSAIGNSFSLDFGLNTNNEIPSYYIDNVKLNLKGITTKINSNTDKLIDIKYINNCFEINKSVQQIEIYNIDAKLLISAKNTSSVNVSNLSRGIYLVKSQVDGQIFNDKILKHN